MAIMAPIIVDRRHFADLLLASSKRQKTRASRTKLMFTAPKLTRLNAGARDRACRSILELQSTLSRLVRTMNRRDILKFSLLAVASASTSRGIQAGITTKSPVLKAAFNDPQRKVVSILAEMIIPQTDTPGAIEAGVPNFIEVMVSDWYTAKERQIFLSGLSDIERICIQKSGLSFSDANAEQKTIALREMEKRAAGYRPPSTAPGLLAGKSQDESAPFFLKLKELTVLGYYTSEIGATQELSYNPAPMRYEGDYDFSKVGRQWSH